METNDFTPAGTNSDRGDFLIGGLVGQPLCLFISLEFSYSTGAVGAAFAVGNDGTAKEVDIPGIGC